MNMIPSLKEESSDTSKDEPIEIHPAFSDNQSETSSDEDSVSPDDSGIQKKDSRRLSNMSFGNRILNNIRRNTVILQQVFMPENKSNDSNSEEADSLEECSDHSGE